MLKGIPKLYYSPYSPPARGAYLVAKALDLMIDLKHVNILTKDYLTPELLLINPQHSIPTLQDGDFVVWDSHAISGYLVGMYGRDDSLYPRSPKKRAIVDQRMHFDTEHLFPKVMQTVYPLLFRHKTAVPETTQAGIKHSYALLEKFLKNSFWLAGNNLTIADLCSVPSISTLDYLVPVTQHGHPKLFDFLERCKRLPYYQEANQMGVDMLGNKIQERLVATPPARAVLLTAKALGLELLYKMVNLRKGEHLEGELLQLNPQHTIPTLDDNGVIIWDSHAINPYLVRKYAKNDLLYPKDFVKRAVVDQRLHFDSGMFHPILRKVMKSANKYGIKPVVTENIKEALKEAYHFLERFLQRSRWVAGDNITIADFCLIASVTTADVVAPINSFTYPKISFWIKNAQALPYYCEANQVGLDSLRKSFEQ